MGCKIVGGTVKKGLSFITIYKLPTITFSTSRQSILKCVLYTYSIPVAFPIYYNRYTC